MSAARREKDRDTHRARRGCIAALRCAVIAAAVLPPALPASAQLSDLVTIRTTVTELLSQSHLLEGRAGADYQPRVLAAVRRSCAKRSVTRLDELEPRVDSDHGAQAAAPALLQIVVSQAGAASRGQAVAASDVPSEDSPGDPAREPAGEPSTVASGDRSGHRAADPSSAPPRATSDRPPGEPSDRPSDAPAVRAFEHAGSGAEPSFTSSAVVLDGGQVRTTSSFAIPRHLIGTIEIDVATSAPGHLLLGWSDSADAMRMRKNHARIELVGDSRPHTYAIDAANALARGLAEDASVRRFFLAARGEAPLAISGLRVLPASRRFAGGPYGSLHVERGGELRSVLYAKPATTLSWKAHVPATSPVFESGLAVVSSDGVLEFEVAVQDGDERTVLLKRLVREAPWEDVALDLEPWAGRDVEVSLAVRGTHDAVALWSSPLLRPRLDAADTEPFLVILEDALRADRLGTYGGPVPSPAHDRIASGGVVFERAFSQSTQTRSSVPSLMTSLLPSATGTWDFSDALSDRYVTLAEALRTCGFATASFLQNGNAGRYAGLAQGFDVVYDDGDSGQRAADLLGPDSALERWIRKQSGRPWFAYVHVLDPHGPYDPLPRPDLPQDDASAPELARDRALDPPWLERPTATARRILYDAEIATNDAAIGAFLDRFDARGDLQRSVIALIADHGEFLGEHGGLWRHHPPGHVEVTHVPFLLRAPREEPAAEAAAAAVAPDKVAASSAKANGPTTEPDPGHQGQAEHDPQGEPSADVAVGPRRVSEPVALLDVMPTLLELAGIDAPPLTLYGESLAGVLRGQTPRRRAIPADEMLLESGPRRATGCGSYVTAAALWLLSCTRDDDFTPGRALPARSSGPVPLRIFDLTLAHFAAEKTPAFGHTVLDTISRTSLVSLQAQNLAVWQGMTDAAAARIVSEPLADERLRSLGYLQ